PAPDKPDNDLSMLAIPEAFIGGCDVHTIQWSKTDGKEAVWIGRSGLKLREHSSSPS
nr:hypothetical protein [Tanacetum cinerariifolium]